MTKEVLIDELRQDSVSTIIRFGWMSETFIVREEPRTKPWFTIWKNALRDLVSRVIDFAKKIPRNPVTDRIIIQLVGTGTSVGANYTEADDSVSKKEFLKCIGYLQKGSVRDQIFSTHGRLPQFPN